MNQATSNNEIQYFSQGNQEINGQDTVYSGGQYMYEQNQESQYQNIQYQENQQGQEFYGNVQNAYTYTAQEQYGQNQNVGYDSWQNQQMQYQMPTGEGYGWNEEPQKPKRKKRILPRILLAVLAVALVVLNFSRICNFTVKAFASPTKYYHYVEKKAAKKMMKSVANVYDENIFSVLRAKELALNGEITLEMGEELQELLLEEKELDLGFLESVSIDYYFSTKKKVTNFGIGTSMNQKELASVKALIDLNEGIGYAQVPILTELFLGVDFEQFLEKNEINLVVEGLDGVTDTLEKMKKSLPKVKDLEKILNRYSERIISCIDNVEEEREEVSAGGLSKKYTVLTVEIDEECMAKIYMELARALKKDKDIEKIIKDFASAIDEVDEDDVYEMFLEAMDELEDEADDLEEEDISIELKTYVDGKGNIVGRKAEIEDEGEAAYIFVQKGLKFGFECYMEEDGEDEIVSLEGSGKLSGGTMEGDFALSVEEEKVCNITVEDMKLLSLLNGEFDGTFKVKPSKSFAKEFDDESEDAPVRMEDMSMVFSGKSKKKTARLKVIVYHKKDPLVTISMEQEEGRASKLGEPEEDEIVWLEEEADFERWADSIDKEAVKEKLREKMGEEAYEMIEKLSSGEEEFPSFGGSEDVWYDDDYYEDYYDDSYYDW